MRFHSPPAQAGVVLEYAQQGEHHAIAWSATDSSWRPVWWCRDTEFRAASASIASMPTTGSGDHLQVWTVTQDIACEWIGADDRAATSADSSSNSSGDRDRASGRCA